jgi:ribonuclease P protein component
VAGPPTAPAGGDGPARADQRLPRRRRLTRRKSFDETYNQGDKHVGRLMVLWLRHGEGAALRLGVVSSRRVGDAVHRSRARRRLREVFRRNRAALRGAVDVVLVARPRLLEAAWPEVEKEFFALAGRAGLLEAPGASPA